MQTYTLKEIESMLGVSRSVVTGLVAAGFVTPARGKRREYRFSFQDVVLLRTAVSLQAAQIPPRRILRSLKNLKATLPGELPLSGLRITAVGNEIAVRQGQAQWGAESGQLLMDFEVRPAPAGTVSFLNKTAAGTGATAPRHADTNDAVHWFERGTAMEAQHPAQAEKAYRRAIEIAPDYLDPVLNLGAMLCDAGRCDEAVLLYQHALQRWPREALLHFNLAIALEDQQRTAEALASYERCLKLDPTFADAHFNAARLHELVGHTTRAIRHYNEYRRLQRSEGGS